MTKEVELKLNGLVHKTFRYQGNKYELKRYRPKDDKMVLETNRRTFVLFNKELEQLLNEIEVVDVPEGYRPKISVETGKLNFDDDNNDDYRSTPPPLSESQADQLKVNLQVYNPTELQKDVQESLRVMLKKVMDDKEAVPQAKAVVDIANTLIQMERNQISLMKSVKRLSR